MAENGSMLQSYNTELVKRTHWWPRTASSVCRLADVVRAPPLSPG